MEPTIVCSPALLQSGPFLSPGGTPTCSPADTGLLPDPVPSQDSAPAPPPRPTGWCPAHSVPVSLQRVGHVLSQGGLTSSAPASGSLNPPTWPHQKPFPPTRFWLISEYFHSASLLRTSLQTLTPCFLSLSLSVGRSTNHTCLSNDKYPSVLPGLPLSA